MTLFQHWTRATKNRFHFSTIAGRSPSKCNETWQQNLKTYQNNIAIIQDGCNVTYDELNDRMNSIAYMFQNEYNLKKGDKIMHLSLPRIDDIPIFMACSKLGINYMSVNPTFNALQLRNISAMSNPSLVITEPKFYENTQSIDTNINRLVLTEDFDPNNWLAQHYINKSPSHSDLPMVTDSDPYQVVFTSGTTGMPKGCVYSHQSVFQGADKAYCKFIGKTTANKDSTLILSSLLGGPGLVQRLSVLFEGSTIIYPNKQLVSSVEHWYDLCENKHPSISRSLFFGRALSDIYHLNKTFSNMESFIYSGDFIPFKTVCYLKKHLFSADAKFMHGYGASEVIWIAHLDPLILNQCIDDTVYMNGKTNINVPVGTPIYDKIFIKIGSDGEVLVKKEDGSGMIEYLNNQKLTREVMSEDGWVSTGDIGYIDHENGDLLYLCGRKKDVIKTSTADIMAPIDIENILYEHVAVDEVAVVGYPNALIDETLSGEVPVAFVCLTKDARQLNDVEIKKELMKICDEMMGDHFQRIKDIFFVDVLPKTPNQKMAKNKLREMINNGQFMITEVTEHTC
eukprot:95551_1